MTRLQEYMQRWYRKWLPTIGILLTLAAVATVLYLATLVASPMGKIPV